MRHILNAIVAVGLSFLCGNASAIVIDTLNSPVAFTISGDIGDGVVLTATGTVTITEGFNSSLLELHVILNNESTLNGIPYTPTSGVQLIGWGFGIDPNVTGVSFADSADAGMIDAKQDSIPNLSGIEVCAWGGNGCSGNSAGGVLVGSSDSFDLLLDGKWGQSVTFDPIGARFLTADGNTFSYQCTGSCTVQSLAALDPTAVPEPQTLALIGLTLLAMGATRGRRRMPISTRT